MDDEKEIWKPVVGYEGYYEVSSYGNVRSLEWKKWNGRVWSIKKGKVLKKCFDRGGYHQVLLYKNGTRKMCKVHRLVAEAFLENPDKLPSINHRDEVKTNNNINNLEFCTVRYNNEYSNVTENARKWAVETLSKSVIQYTKDGQFVAEYPSTREAKRQTGINQGDISSCCLGRKNHQTAGGYIWRYKEKTP